MLRDKGSDRVRSQRKKKVHARQPVAGKQSNKPRHQTLYPYYYTLLRATMFPFILLSCAFPAKAISCLLDTHSMTTFSLSSPLIFFGLLISHEYLAAGTETLSTTRPWFLAVLRNAQKTRRRCPKFDEWHVVEESHVDPAF